MSASTGINYQPSYFVDCQPDRFGGKQSDYLAKSVQYIQETAARITAARKNGEDLTQLFFTVIADLSSKRAELAKAHDTPKAELFGLRRDRCRPGLASHLTLTYPYQHVADKLLELFAKHLKGLESNGKFQESLKIQDACRKRITTLQINVIDQEDLERRENCFTFDDLPDYFSRAYINTKREWTEAEKIDFRSRVERFKKEKPEHYRHIRFFNAIRELDKSCPQPIYRHRTHIVHTVLRTSVDGSLYSLNEYFTWLNKNADTDPLQDMLTNSKVLTFQQDEFLIQKTLDEIAKVFQRAVSWTREQPLTELKSTMAEFCYLTAHNMRDVRGTAAATEWLERAIYSMHGIEYRLRDKSQLVDLEAYAHPLFSDFLKAYYQLVELKMVYTETPS